MRQRFASIGRMALVLAGTAAEIGFLPSGQAAHAAPPFAQALASQPSQVTQAKIYRRGRTPIYPYYYNPGRPGGYSFYFGFIPYAKGDIENQALQRGFYPQDNIEWPESMRAYGPRPGWGPKRSD